MKNKKIIIGLSIVGLVVLFGVVAISAKAGVSFSWLRVEESVAQKIADKVPSPDMGEEVLGAATMVRTGSSARAASGAFDNTTSTFAFWTNNTGRDIVIDEISLAIDANLSAGPQKASPVLVVATSSATGATSTNTLNSLLIYQAFTTSTNVQKISTSTFTENYKAFLANGDSVIFGFDGGMGASTTWPKRNTPSSTGSFNIRYFTK